MPFCVHCGAQDINDPVYCNKCSKRFSEKKKKKGKPKKKQYNDFVITAPAAKPKPAQPLAFKTTKVVTRTPPKKKTGGGQRRRNIPKQQQPKRRTAVAPMYTTTTTYRSQPKPRPQQTRYQQPPPPRRQYQSRPQPAYVPPPSPPPQRRQQPPPKRRSPPPRKNKDSGGGGWKIFVAIVVIMLIFLGLMYVFFAKPEVLDEIMSWGDNIDPNMRVFPEESEFELKRVLTISIEDSIDEYTLKGASPDQIPADGFRQNVIEFSPDPGPTQTIPDVGDNEVLMWREYSVTGQRQIVLYYHITSHSYEWDIDEKNSGDIADIPQDYVDRYTGDEWPVVDDFGAPVPGESNQYYRFHPSNPEIQKIATDLKGDETNVYKIIKDIYEWVVDKHDYPSASQMQEDNPKNWNLPKCPVITMRDKRGDCDDQSFLFGSLCRAVGIPAWMVLGGLYDCMKEEWCGHGWAEVYVPLKDGGHEKVTVDCVNQEFMFRDCFRYADWTDTGGNITIDGEDAYNLDWYYHLFSHKGGRLGTRGDADIQESYIDVAFDSKGIINKPIDGPGGKYILPGLNADPDSSPGFEGTALVGSMVGCLVLSVAVMSRKRGKKR